MAVVQLGNGEIQALDKRAELVRQHFTGLLWVPSDVGFYEERRKLVLALKGQGVPTREIARLSGVTPRRVRQIVAQSREESIPTHRDPLR